MMVLTRLLSGSQNTTDPPLAILPLPLAKQRGSLPHPADAHLLALYSPTPRSPPLRLGRIGVFTRPHQLLSILRFRRGPFCVLISFLVLRDSDVSRFQPVVVGELLSRRLPAAVALTMSIFCLSINPPAAGFWMIFSVNASPSPASSWPDRRHRHGRECLYFKPWRPSSSSVLPGTSKVYSVHRRRRNTFGHDGYMDIPRCGRASLSLAGHLLGTHHSRDPQVV